MLLDQEGTNYCSGFHCSQFVTKNDPNSESSNSLQGFQPHFNKDLNTMGFKDPHSFLLHFQLKLKQHVDQNRSVCCSVNLLHYCGSTS